MNSRFAVKCWAMVIFWGCLSGVCFADLGADINACVAALPAAGGTCDFRNKGVGTAAATITLNKPVTLLLDGTQLTVNGSPGIQVAGHGVRIRGAVNTSQLIQGTADRDVIGGSAVTNFEVRGISFVGQAAPITASQNSGVFLSNSAAGHISRIRVIGNAFIGFRFHAVYLQNATNVEVADNAIWHVSGGIRFSGVHHGKILRNVVTDTQVPNTTFTVAIGLDSTDPINDVNYPPCTYIQIVNNTVKTYVDAQGILVHAGSHITISKNVLTDVLIGISMNPYNMHDTEQYLTVTGNVYTGTLTAGAPSNLGNYGIFIGGGPQGSAYIPQHATIEGNFVTQANEVVKSSTQGGIGIGWANDVKLKNNSVDNSLFNGIALTNPNTRLLITQNKVTSLVSPTAGIPTVGLYGINGVQTGKVRSNFVAFVNDGYRFDVASPGVLFGPNTAIKVDTVLYNPQNVTIVP
jgi:hypothetical protein